MIASSLGFFQGALQKCSSNFKFSSSLVLKYFAVYCIWAMGFLMEEAEASCPGAGHARIHRIIKVGKDL